MGAVPLPLVMASPPGVVTVQGMKVSREDKMKVKAGEQGLKVGVEGKSDWVTWEGWALN